MNTAEMESPMQQLVEHVRDWRSGEVTVDATRRIVSNVALTGLESKNGYRYSESALRDAIGLYENKPVFLDHAINSARPYERSTRDLVGSIVNPRFAAGRVRADIAVLDTEAGRTFLALAENRSPMVGMSHVVLAERSADKSVVEKIHDVVSVDAVVFPATTSTFRESVDASNFAFGSKSLESVVSEIDSQLSQRFDAADQARRADVFPGRVLVEVCGGNPASATHVLVEWRIEEGRVVLGETSAALVGCDLLMQPAIIRVELETTRRERDDLARRLAEIEAERQQAAIGATVDRMLSEAAMPAKAVNEQFRRQLIAADSDERRRELIEERRALVRLLRSGLAFSRERGEPGPKLSDRTFVDAIKGPSRRALTGIV